ncbi:PilN domain-containing protein [Halodesulfovibrio sp.]|uniref:GspL/Epsl periplasmic domain-containing protein n=1 Tax=Halodesulfovibrio sp. TaxID=1912772 RepID=UPI0025C2D987|nr:PilN domain-containing protein [Halodesulfovibrio sp.]
MGVRTTTLLKSYCFSANILKEPVEAVAKLASIIDLRQLHSANYKLSLPDSGVIFSNWHFPFNSSKKISQTLYFDLEQSLPFAPKDILSDALIGTQSQKGRSVLSASIPKHYLATLLTAFQEVNIYPELLTVTALSTAQTVAPLCEPSTTLFIFVDESHTQLIQLTNKSVCAAIQIPVGITSNAFKKLTPNILKRKNVSSHPTPQEQEKHKTLRQQLTRLARQAVIAASNLSEPIHQIILYGNITNADECEVIFTRETGVPVSAFQNHKAASLLPSSNIEKWTTFLPALALSKNNNSFFQKKKHISFSKDEFAFLGNKPSLQTNIFYLSSLLGIAMLSIALLFFAQGYQKSRQVDALNTEIFSTLKHTLPEVNGTFNRIQYTSILKSRLAQLRGQTNSQAASERTALDTILAIHKTTPGSLNIQLEHILYSKKNITISGTAVSYETIEKFHTCLAGNTLFRSVVIQNAASQQKQQRIRFDIKISMED